MLQRLAAWCYRRRRSVVVLWIVALVAVSVIGSNVGASFSQGFSLTDTESARAAQLLETRFPARAGDEGQIVFAHARRACQDAAVQARMEKLFAEVAKVPGVTAVVSPYSADGARQVARSGDIAYATVQFDKQASKIPDATIEHIRTLKDDADGWRRARSRSAGACSRSRAASARPSSSASSPPSSSCSSRSVRCSRWDCPS